MTEPTLDGHKRCLALRWIAAEREHVFDLLGFQLIQGSGDLVAIGAHTGQVGERFNADVGLDPCHQFDGFSARGPARSVGHGDECRVERGQVLARPGSVKPHRTFEAEVYVLTKDEGGRHTPFFRNYRPQFYFRTTDVTGAVALKEGAEMVMPGDNTELTIELHEPVAIEEKSRFAIREGNKTVGAGIVTRIIA